MAGHMQNSPAFPSQRSPAVVVLVILPVMFIMIARKGSAGRRPTDEHACQQRDQQNASHGDATTACASSWNLV